ncbi:P-loop ATPase, Sll1717 family [Pseudomonas monsensis]
MTDDIPSIEDLMMSLQYYVPTGTAEGEKYILQEAFVQTHEYADIIAPPIGSPRLLVGKKGSGKSAILDFTLRFLKDAGLPGLLIKPLSLDLSAMGENASSGELTRIAYNAIMKAVSEEITKQLPAMVTGDNAELLDSAIASGVMRADFVSKFVRVLNGFAKPFTGYDFSSLLPSATSANCKRLERLVRSNIATSKEAFYILIDDTDQVANPGTKNHLNRIWACILAARELTLNNDKIRCVITLRDEIWRSLEKEGSGQRDQIDHFRPLVYRVNPSLEHVQRIIEKRLVLAAKHAGYETVNANYSLFFEGDMPRMPFSEKRSSWPDLIKSRSRERPRDAVQLVNMMVKVALKDEAKKIDDDILSTVMPIYSKERAELVAGEYEAECPQMIHVIRSLYKLDYKHGAFLADTESVRTHLVQIQSSFTITINGVALKPAREEDVLSLWALLFQAGVFYPRVSDSRQKEGYRFVLPHEEPGLITKARWNDLQQSLWEVHPAFRDFLIAEKNEQSARFGLASKPARSKAKRS